MPWETGTEHHHLPTAGSLPVWLQGQKRNRIVLHGSFTLSSNIWTSFIDFSFTMITKLHHLHVSSSAGSLISSVTETSPVQWTSDSSVPSSTHPNPHQHIILQILRGRTRPPHRHRISFSISPDLPISPSGGPTVFSSSTSQKQRNSPWTLHSSRPYLHQILSTVSGTLVLFWRRFVALINTQLHILC